MVKHLVIEVAAGGKWHLQARNIVANSGNLMPVLGDVRRVGRDDESVLAAVDPDAVGGVRQRDMDKAGSEEDKPVFVSVMSSPFGNMPTYCREGAL